MLRKIWYKEGYWMCSEMFSLPVIEDVLMPVSVAVFY